MRESGNNAKGYIAAQIDGVLQDDRDAFHTPGHKGILCARDITELGRNNERFPADAIERAEARSAELYGVPHMRYLVNGSSIGIKAALWLFRGKTVLYAPGVHRAFTEGCTLAGITAVPAYGEDRAGEVYTCGCDDLPPPLTCEQAERALDAHPDAAALFLTSPDYFGRTADLRIAELCRKRGVAILADGAHGAHFAFAPGLSAYGWEKAADACNMSAHKTLGAYTQTALLAVREPYADRINEALALLGTTSPNYVLLERLEQSVLAAAEQTEEYGRLRDFTASLRSSVDLLPNTDYTRLCVRPDRCDAAEGYRRLTAAGIFPEAVIGERIVLILTPFDPPEKLERLRRALTERL